MNKAVRDELKEHLYKDVLHVAEADIPWEELKDKTIMITGAGGFIGFYLVASLLIRNDDYAQNTTVLAVVRSLERARAKYGALMDSDDLIFIEQDVCAPFVKCTDDDEYAEEFIGSGSDQVSCDYIIHAASQASAWHFENDPVGTIRANLVGTDNILALAKECNAKTLIISSLKTYGRVTSGVSSLSEETRGDVDFDLYKNCYAVGKRAAENLAACYSKQYGMDIKLVRPSYIYGAASLDDDRVWAQFIANVIRGENILLKSNGAPYRSFCYVSDTARAIYTVLLKGENMTPYNIADDIGNITIRDFAKEAVNAFPEKHLTLSFANPEDEQEPVQDYSSQSPEILDSTKLKSLGWKAEVDISSGIKRAVAILLEKC